MKLPNVLILIRRNWITFTLMSNFAIMRLMEEISYNNIYLSPLDLIKQSSVPMSPNII